MALGVAAYTVGKLRASTVFMCVCSMFRSSDFLLFVKKRIRHGSTYAECTSGSLKERRLQLRIPHCLSATRRLALNNRSLLNTACQPHTRCTLNWVRQRGREGATKDVGWEGGKKGRVGDGGRKGME